MNHYETIKKAIGLIVKYKLANQSLEALALALCMSPGHLRKVFVAWVGISPKQFNRYLSLEYAKELLAQRNTNLTTTYRAGLSSGGRLHDLFLDVEAMTPGDYGNGGNNLTIAYITFASPFGLCLVGATKRGVCS